MTTTFDGIRAIIVRDFELPPERLQRDTLLEEIELDSLSITELVFAIEDEFEITAENTIPAFKTLGDIADYVARLVAERDTKPRVAAKSAATAATPSRIAAAPAPGQSRPGAKKARSGDLGAESDKRARGNRTANKKSAKRTNGASRSNVANADGARRTTPRAAKRPPQAGPKDAQPRKPKAPGSHRAGARGR